MLSLSVQVALTLLFVCTSWASPLCAQSPTSVVQLGAEQAGPASSQEAPPQSGEGADPREDAPAPSRQQQSKPRVSSAPSKDSKSDEVLSGMELWERTDEVDGELEQFRAQLQIPPHIEDLRRELEQKGSELRHEAARARDEIADAARWFVINSIRFRFSQKQRELAQLRAPFDAFVDQVGGAPARVKQLHDEWKEIQATLTEVGAPLEIRTRVRELVVSLQVLRLHASRAEATIGRTRSLFERTEASIESVLKVSRAGRATLLMDFSKRPPQRAPAKDWLEIKERLAESFGEQLQAWLVFTKSSMGTLLFHMVLTLILIMATWRARWFYQRAQRVPLSKDHLVVEHPTSSALLLSAMATLFLYPVVPALGLFGIMVVATGAAAILLTKQRRGVAAGVFALILLVAAHVFLVELPRLDRFTLLIETVVVLYTSWQMMRLPLMRGEGGWGQLGRVVCNFWLLCGTLGLVAWGLSYSMSASILIDGTARIILTTLAYRVAYDVASSLLELGSVSPWALSLNAFSHHRQAIVSRLQLVLRWCLFFLWARSFLQVYKLRGIAEESFERLLNATLNAGTLDFSVRSLFVLLMGIALAVVSARIVRFFLAEDVMPRTRLRIGTWTAITSSTYYVILGFGIFTALAAAGVQLDRLTILVSALGVGIGFGLQNIVQNFISGVILMFERPVNIGDKIQIDDMFGKVETIGFRASRMRTFDGAEVIVPNSDLISDRVINWSLSDDRRRIEVAVGVAYGTEPKRVLDLLLSVAADHPDVLGEPAPEALFWEFGESSLNFRLRCFTDEGSLWMNIKSDLTVAIDERLRREDIEIPFPQRDLHVRSMEENFAGLLTKRDTKEQ